MMTSEETVALTTVRDIQAAFEMIGLRWSVREIDDPLFGAERSHLYAWVIGRPRNDPDDRVDLRDRGIIYIGEDQQTGGRTATEYEWIRAEYEHAHAIAGYRTKARCLSGSVINGPMSKTFAMKAVTEAAEKLGRDADVARLALASGMELIRANDDTVLEFGGPGYPRIATVESLAIRLTVHIGDVGAPVNAAKKIAWRIKSNELELVDDLAFWLARAVEVRPSVTGPPRYPTSGE